jgi:putative metalloenzyme radical SAM/SPASM domain maturase
MCVKQTTENNIIDGDLSMNTFRRLISAFPHLNALVLTGIGEPLLHPDLEKFIVLAKKHLAPNSWVGFQTNGYLLNRRRAKSVINAGVDRICFSVDATSSDLCRKLRVDRSAAKIEDTFKIINSVRSTMNKPDLEIGIEFVLTRSNMHELPSVLTWAANNGATFAIVSHMLAYKDILESEVVYNPSTDVSWRFYQNWELIAKQKGLDIKKYFQIRWKPKKNREEKKIIRLVEQMVSEASDRGIPIDFRNLIVEGQFDSQKVSALFEVAQQIAKEHNLNLQLPALRPRKDRTCNFAEEGSAFVSWNGNVHPCYFLWHRYVCYQNKSRKYVMPKSFGDLSRDNILQIWNSPDFMSFRSEVLSYNYPFCGNCILRPCDLIRSENFEADCHATSVPCGDCPWCLGLLRCLQ